MNPILNYRAANSDRRRCIEGLLRIASIYLVISAGICVFAPYRVPVLVVCRGVVVLAGIGWIFRTFDRARFVSRLAWGAGAIAFGLWSTVILANQFHGSPPATDRYLLAIGALATAFSSVGFVLDMQDKRTS